MCVLQHQLVLKDRHYHCVTTWLISKKTPLLWVMFRTEMHISNMIKEICQISLVAEKMYLFIYLPGNSKAILADLNSAASKSLTMSFNSNCYETRLTVCQWFKIWISVYFPNQACALWYLHGIPLSSMSLVAWGLADCHHAALASWPETDWDI